VLALELMPQALDSVVLQQRGSESRGRLLGGGGGDDVIAA